MSPERVNNPAEAWRRFSSFIERHTEKRDDPLIGEVKRGLWKFKATNQLVPINRIQFEIFDNGLPAIETVFPAELIDRNRDLLGYSMKLYIDDIPIYNLLYLEGKFWYEIGDGNQIELEGGENIAEAIVQKLEFYEIIGALEPLDN